MFYFQLMCIEEWWGEQKKNQLKSDDALTNYSHQTVWLYRNILASYLSVRQIIIVGFLFLHVVTNHVVMYAWKGDTCASRRWTLWLMCIYQRNHNQMNSNLDLHFFRSLVIYAHSFFWVTILRLFFAEYSSVMLKSKPKRFAKIIMIILLKDFFLFFKHLIFVALPDVLNSQLDAVQNFFNKLVEMLGENNVPFIQCFSHLEKEISGSIFFSQ